MIKRTITLFFQKRHQRAKPAPYSDLEALRHQIALIELYRNAGQQACADSATRDMHRQADRMFDEVHYRGMNRIFDEFDRLRAGK